MFNFGGSFYSPFVKIIYHKKALSEYLATFRQEGRRVGLVPTMGALHPGHLSLLNYIKGYCDISVCSIFVNPTQFNDPEDLEKYPRPIEQDLVLLEEIGCDIVFIPAVEEMYGEKEEWTIDLGRLDQVLEGALRPGHYQGVTQVVKKLFDIVRPDVACFGQKDYQQFLVIKKMVEIFFLDINLIMCPTLREQDGLAMSSRNARLSASGHQQALAIFQTLHKFQDNYLDLGVGEAREQAIETLTESEGLTLEYFEVCELQTLKTVRSAKKGDPLIVLVAAWVDGVRLIDNIILGQST